MGFYCAEHTTVFPFLIVYWAMYGWKKDKRASLRTAMDVTTVFLIFSVSALFNLTFDSNFGFYLTMILILIALGLIGGAQNRLKGKVDGVECSGPFGAWPL